MARLKYGICSGHVDKYGKIKTGKALGIYGEGMVYREKIEEDIIPFVVKREKDFPIIIYSYYSEPQPSKTGLDIIMSKKGVRFKPNRQKPGSKSYDWYIDENKKVFQIRNLVIQKK